jgi:four helix bundle protein
MFLQLAHTKLDIYTNTRKLVAACYSAIAAFPIEERYGLVQQIKRAALSVHLNLAEGCSRKAPGERKRYFEIARGSVIEIDAALDIAVDLNYTTKEHLQTVGESIINCFGSLTGLIKSTENKP